MPQQCPVCLQEDFPSNQQWCTLSCDCKCVDNEVTRIGRDICKACVGLLLTMCDGLKQLKCPVCRTTVESYTTKQITSITEQLKKNDRKRKRNDENGDDDIQEISQVIGIEALSRDEVYYLVMWKKTDGTGILNTVWQDQSFVQGVKVDEFHKRFCIPPVTSLMFKFPTYLEHPPIKTIRRGRGPIVYKCSKCDYQSSRCNNVVTHMGVNHSNGNAKELYIKCVTCEKQFNTPGNLVQHVTKCWNLKDF